MKPVVALLFTLVLGTAPFQCANDPDENTRLEDTPAEALWNLSEHFRERGMTDARNDTLRQIVDQYPSSREAHQAQMVLDGRELTPQPTGGETSATEGATPAQAATP